MDAVFTLGTMGSPLPPLPRLHLQLQRCWELLLATSGWDEGLPVPVLDRSWLQLDILSIDALLGQFPVDSSAHAPELVRFQSLLEQGMPGDEAEQLCWQDFGPEACHRALRRFWQEQQQPSCLWSLEDYLTLIERYRRTLHSGKPELPLLVLPRRDGKQRLSCHWLPKKTGDRPN